MKQIGTLLLLFFITLTSLASIHKFYVSITEIAHNHEDNTLEMSTKIFYDDLMEAVYIEEGVTINDPLNDWETEIDNYIQRHFHIKLNNEIVQMNMVGIEPEIDAVWCHYKSEPIPENILSIEVFNNILVDLFKSQSNIINFFPDKNDINKVNGLLLNSRNQSGKIQIK